MKWTADEVREHLRELNLRPCTLFRLYVLREDSAGALYIRIWSRDSRRHAKIDNDELHLVMNSQAFDFDLYHTLSEFVGIDQAVAFKICLS